MRAAHARTAGLFMFVFFGLLANSPAVSADPPAFENLSLIKSALRQYVQSGDYARDIAAVVREAEAYLSARVAKPDAQGQGKLAIVLDIDDTALSTWANLAANDFGLIKNGPCDLPRGPCGWPAWQALGEAPAIEPTLALAQQARRLGLAVFFISGRNEKFREATARNLRTSGYADWNGLILRTMRTHDRTTHPHDRSAADFKAPARRELVQQGYVIVLNVGDQESDLAGGYAERTFKLPNPFYLIP